MKKLMKTQAMLMAIGIVWSLILISGCSYQSDNVSEVISDEPSVALVYYDLTDAEIESLMYMVEKVKMAMDVYTLMDREYRLKIFENIEDSEERHLRALSSLIDKYDLHNPVQDKLGEFENKEIKEMFEDYKDSALISRIEAKLVGVAIEESEIGDLEDALGEVIVAGDLKKAYTNILEASIKHLTAFEKELK